MARSGHVRDDSAGCCANSSANNRPAGGTGGNTANERAARATEKCALGHARISGIGARSDRQSYDAQYDDIFHVSLPVKALKYVYTSHHADPFSETILFPNQHQK